MRTRFVAGKAATLKFAHPYLAAVWPVEPAGVISATVTIRGADGRDLPTPVVDAAATASNHATQLTANAAAGDRSLTVYGAFPASLGADAMLVVQAADGERVVAEASSLGGSATGLTDPLPRALAAGDKVNAVQVAYDLAAEQLVDPLTRPGHLYRAVWAITIDGAFYQFDELFEVRKRLLTPTLTEVEVGRYLPARLEELMDGGPRALRAIMGEAWDDVLDDAASRGYEPDKIVDCDRLRRPHRSRTLAVLAASWGPAWKDWAAKLAVEYGRDIDAALNAGDWYDSAEDAIQAADEAKVTSVRLTR